MPKIKTVSIARKHIMAAIESCPCELDFPKYTITSVYYREPGRAGNSGVRITWDIK